MLSMNFKFINFFLRNYYVKKIKKWKKVGQRKNKLFNESNYKFLKKILRFLVFVVIILIISVIIKLGAGPIDSGTIKNIFVFTIIMLAGLLIEIKMFSEEEGNKSKDSQRENFNKEVDVQVKENQIEKVFNFGITAYLYAPLRFQNIKLLDFTNKVHNDNLQFSSSPFPITTERKAKLKYENQKFDLNPGELAKTFFPKGNFRCSQI